MMKILVGYDGSESADAALDDLRRAGLPREAKALIVSVGEVSMAPLSSSYEVVGQVMTSRRVTSAIALAQSLNSTVAQSGERVRSKIK